MTSSALFESALELTALPMLVAVFVLMGCAVLPLPQVVLPTDAYGQSPDSKLACKLLQASRCAYSIVDTGQFNQRDISYYACADGATDRRAIADRELRLNAVMLALNADSVIIAYRGTLPLRADGDWKKTVHDWIQDAEAEPTQESGIRGQMHRGFHTAFVQTSDDVFAVLKEWGDSGKLAGKSIYVTGHSKGGATALIAALHLYSAGYVPTAVYTFASARAGDEEFIQGFSSKGISTWRYENRFDIVPHLPPNSNDGALIEALLDRNESLRHDEYQSVGRLMFVNWDGRLTASYPALNGERLTRFRVRLAAAGAEKAIVEAHSSAIDAQYAQAICR